jgi:hypothetical protein
MMTKFKIGDRVRYIGKDHRHHDPEQIGNCGTVRRYENDDTVEVDWDDKKIRGAKYSDNLELIPTFEVGKTYINSKNGTVPFIVLFIGNDKVFTRNQNGVEGSRGINNPDIIEYIPPPPEEWRALFYRKDGKPEISANYWSSKEEVEKSESGRAFEFMYALRTDAGVLRTDINAKENK